MSIEKNNSILMIVTSHDKITEDHKTGVYLEEFAVPYNVFKEEGFNIEVASIKGGQVPLDPQSDQDDNQIAMWTEAIAVLKNTKNIKEISASNYIAVFIPGGHGTMFDFPQDITLQKILQEFAESNKVIASVCHGPAAFIGVNYSDGTPIVKGKTITSFTDEEEKIIKLDSVVPFLLETKFKELGAKFVAAEPFTDHIEEDGNILTGQNPMSSESLAKAVLSVLEK